MNWCEVQGGCSCAANSPSCRAPTLLCEGSVEGGAAHQKSEDEPWVPTLLCDWENRGRSYSPGEHRRILEGVVEC